MSFIEDLSMVFAGGIAKYRADLLKMAKENWTPEQVKMLERLCGAVIAQKPYEEYEGEADEDFDKMGKMWSGGECDGKCNDNN